MTAKIRIFAHNLIMNWLIFEEEVKMNFCNQILVLCEILTKKNDKIQ